MLPGWSTGALVCGDSPEARGWTSHGGFGMTDGDWDFEVRRVDLNGLGIDAGQRLGMVIVQPEYELVVDGAVPFRISDPCREAQNSLIQRAFQIRAAESQERKEPIPFVLFPEYAIPVREPNGLSSIRQQMEDAQGDVIFVGGLEGLGPQEALEIAEEFAPGIENARPNFAPFSFVNVCVIVVKSATGHLGWYFQAKLRPSQWEQQRNMALGRRTLYFVAPQVAFLCQICFDHIAAQGEDRLNAALYHKLIEGTKSHAAALLDFVFVPQYNPQPDHASMRKNTASMLNFQDRAIKNDMTTVIFVNRASRVQEPSEYGRSGFHYRTGRWQIPTSDVGPKGYELFDQGDTTSAVFRKRTDAIHVATLVPPSHNTGNSGNPRRPLDTPRSYLIGRECGPCSCLPGIACAVGKFVECDCLPCKLHDALPAGLPAEDAKKRWQGYSDDQSQRLGRHYTEIRENLLKLECARARDLVYLFLHMHDPKNSKNPDVWLEPQVEAVVELLSALSVLAELQPVNFQTTPQWTALLGDALAVALLDGEDRQHYCEDMQQKYWEAFAGQYYRPDARRKPVLLAALRSRGLVKPLVKPFSPDYTKPADPNRLGDQDSFAKPIPLRLYVCQDALFEGAKRATTTITEFLKSEMECILG